MHHITSKCFVQIFFWIFKNYLHTCSSSNLTLKLFLRFLLFTCQLLHSPFCAASPVSLFSIHMMHFLWSSLFTSLYNILIEIFYSHKKNWTNYIRGSYPSWPWHKRVESVFPIIIIMSLSLSLLFMKLKVYFSLTWCICRKHFWISEFYGIHQCADEAHFNGWRERRQVSFSGK